MILAHGADNQEKRLTNSDDILKMSIAGDQGNLGYANQVFIKRIQDYINDTLSNTNYTIKSNGMQTLLDTLTIFRTQFRGSRTIMGQFPRLDRTTAFKATHPECEHTYYFRFTAIEIAKMGFTSRNNLGINFISGTNAQGSIPLAPFTNVNYIYDYKISIAGEPPGDIKLLSQIIADTKILFNVKNVGIIDCSCRSLPIDVIPQRSANLLRTLPIDPIHGIIMPNARPHFEQQPRPHFEQKPRPHFEKQPRPDAVAPDELFHVNQPLTHKLKYPPATIRDLPNMNQEAGLMHKMSKYNLKKRRNRHSKRKYNVKKINKLSNTRFV